MAIDPRIFRAYDIRGRVPEQLDSEACFLIAQAFGTHLRRIEQTEHPTVVVGRDARTHGPTLETAVVEGLMKAGCRVQTIDAVPTPVNYYTVANTDTAGGIQVTASHNPAHDNGLKLSTRGMHAFSGDDLQRLREQIDRGDLEEHPGGSAEAIPAQMGYIDAISNMFDRTGEGLRVVVDGGNGIAGPVNCEVLRGIGCEVDELYTDPDGTFPNHPADPSNHATLKDLQARVLAEGAHLGIAFDGDGDRAGIVDETGAIRSADEILLLLAEDHLKRHPGGAIVCTVSNSSLLLTEVERWGGKPVMSKVGHSFVEHAMVESGALLGGEQSGHFFCADVTGGYDDGLVAAIRVITILKQSGMTASQLFSRFPKVYQAPERRPHCDDDKKRDVVAKATGFFAASHPVNTLDGARIDFGDGAWAGIRYSNTSPCLSICMEARSPDKLAEVEKAVMEHLETYPEIEWNKK